jgi:DNA-directed RNA polymerase specialized sigma24 family protein
MAVSFEEFWEEHERLVQRLVDRGCGKFRRGYPWVLWDEGEMLGEAWWELWGLWRSRGGRHTGRMAVSRVVAQSNFKVFRRVFARRRMPAEGRVCVSLDELDGVRMPTADMRAAGRERWPLERVLDREAEELGEEWFGVLGAREREVMRLRVAGFDGGEICDRLRMASGTMWSTLAHARGKLRGHQGVRDYLLS